jgi:hypothetical protein
MSKRIEGNAGLGMESFSYVVFHKATEPELLPGDITTPTSLLRALVSHLQYIHSSSSSSHTTAVHMNISYCLHYVLKKERAYSQCSQTVDALLAIAALYTAVTVMKIAFS